MSWAAGGTAHRWVVALGALVSVLSGAGGSHADVPPSVGAYRVPISGDVRIVHPYSALANRFAAGHRGVDLATRPDEPVYAAAAGRVTFAGSITGRGVVVIAHNDGVRTEYEPLSPSVVVGQIVAPGQPIGVVQGVHGDCPLSQCLHWGARRGADYVNPMLLLRPLGPVRLVPLA